MGRLLCCLCWHEVQATFLLALLLPPPAASTLGFAEADGAGAGRTADGWKALVVQRVIGNSIVGHVTDEVLPAPIRQGIELDQTIAVIPGRKWHVGAKGRLFGAQARDPGRRPRQRPTQ